MESRHDAASLALSGERIIYRTSEYIGGRRGIENGSQEMRCLLNFTEENTNPSRAPKYTCLGKLLLRLNVRWRGLPVGAAPFTVDCRARCTIVMPQLPEITVPFGVPVHGTGGKLALLFAQACTVSGATAKQ